jgi:SAM-dependent methyltransferase
MTRRSETIEASYFEDLYRADPDPWRFRSSDYERDKYRATLQALSRKRYRQGLEIGCAIGVLTRQLAERCVDLLAMDGSSLALTAARAECVDCSGVSFRQGMVPADFPEGRFDLIILSEVLYYLVPNDLEATAAKCLDALQPGGELILCHWLGETDYPLTGQAASDLFVAAALTRPLSHVRLVEGTYRLERLQAL